MTVNRPKLAHFVIMIFLIVIASLPAGRQGGRQRRPTKQSRNFASGKFIFSLRQFTPGNDSKQMYARGINAK